MLASVWSGGLYGLDGYPVHIEVDCSAGLPYWEIVGLPDAAVKESRERVRSADGGSGAIFSDCRRPGIPFTKIPAPSGQGGSAADVCRRYSSLSLRRSAFSATIRWSMQSWMSPSMKAARL